jgi:hypothetical protein
MSSRILVLISYCTISGMLALSLRLSSTGHKMASHSCPKKSKRIPNLLKTFISRKKEFLLCVCLSFVPREKYSIEITIPLVPDDIR